MATQKRQPKTQKAKGQTIRKNTAAASPTSTQNRPEEEKRRLIEEAAYFIAERRGFQGDMVLDDWLQAEREVNSRSASTH
ncbi:MAG: DUF2934 domain-containing protein [Candidatus Thiodiazotropha sp.]|jgi:hypothetical protein